MDFSSLIRAKSYLGYDQGTALLQWLSKWFKEACIVLYDPIRMNDAFGHIQQSYFKAKGCELRAFNKRDEGILDIKRFLLHADWQTLCAFDMNAIWKSCVNLQHLQTIESFDEYADLALVNAHYALSVAVNSSYFGTNKPSFRFFNTFCGSYSNGNRAHSFWSKTLIIRSIEASDYDEVRKLIRMTESEITYAKKAVKKFMSKHSEIDFDAKFRNSKKPAHFWVATKNDELVGCIGLKHTSKSSNAAEISHLSVNKQHRQQKIGSYLMRIAERFALEKGYERILLQTLEEMKAAY